MNKITTALLAGASIFAFSSAAAAQTTVPKTPSAADATQVGEVVITGSRVIKNGNASPTPVTVVNTEQLTALQPGPVAEAIANLPVFSGSRTSASNPTTGVSNAGANELTLRNIGVYRTLILYDGHRVAPATYDQIVDVDMIPQMLIQRVDVVTGGVSAVYGSDAIAGVVNFVTDTKFNGLKLDLQRGVSQRGDDPTATAGIAIGRSFMADRGHVELSYQYHDDPGILYRSKRQWGANVWTTQGGGIASNPYHLVINSRINTATFGGLISGATGAGAALNGQTFSDNGVLSPFVHGIATGNASYESGGSGAYWDGSLKSALRSHQFFGRVDYDFTDTIHGYVSGSSTINHTQNFGPDNQLTNLTFSGQNAFFPAAKQFTGTFKLSEFIQDMGRIDANSNQNQYFVVAGLNGTFGGSYKWDLAFSHGNNRSTTRNDNQINNQLLYAALDAVKDAAGNIVCHVTLTNPTLYPGCVPLNAFGPTAANPQAIAYITQPTQFTVNNGQDDVSGSVSGSPFKTWAGPVTMALSGEWRRQTWSVASTGTPSQLADCTGLIITGTTSNCSAGKTVLYADTTLANRSTVSNTVYEGALETEVPLLKDTPFARDLSFNGAVRYADYKTSGSAVTWKLGLVWQIDDQLKLRGNRSRDFRAPTLYDLFQPLQVSLTTHTDLLTGVSAPVPTYTSGNPNLGPEVSDYASAGFVYQPNWLPRFSLSMDAYHMTITNALVNENGFGNTQPACYTGAPAASLPLFCSLMTRPFPITNTTVANAVTSWTVETLNISKVEAYGADFEANYAATVLGNPLTLRGLLTWQPHNIINVPGAPPTEIAGSAFPSSGPGGAGAEAAAVVQATLFVDYKIRNLDIGILEHWRSPLSLVALEGQVFAPTATVVSTQYTDLNLSYKLDKALTGAEVFLNIRNLFDLQPPPAAGPGQNSNIGTFGGFAIGDDPIGRYFNIGFRFRH